MVRKFFHKKSKRLSCRTKYKIEKKIKEHQKKTRKELKLKGAKPKLKKDPGVPNSFPFKERILKEAELRKQREKELKEKQKLDRQKVKDKKRNLKTLVADAEKRGKDFDKGVALQDEGGELSAFGSCEGSLKAYYREFKKVVEAADIVLEVLDARDPMGSRCPQVEQSILSSGCEKKLILVLNKIDLVPRENVEKWLKYLRNEFPTVPFKASTQSQSGNLSQVRVRSLAAMNKDLLQGKHSLGANMMLKLIGNYCRSSGMKTAVSVGVIGFPNVGKSSIINSLKRSKVCGVGSVPGITKNMQEVSIDKHVKILDSPGIIMADMRRDPVEAALKNCVRINDISEPRDAVEAILRRCPKEQLMLRYNMPHFTDTDDFLSLLARRFGQMKKGGKLDVGKAGRTLLTDWTTGKITYYTEPPEVYKPHTHISAKIVEKMSEPFDMNALATDEASTLEHLKPTGTSSDIILKENELTDGVATTEDLNDLEEMEETSEDESDGEEMAVDRVDDSGDKMQVKGVSMKEFAKAGKESGGDSYSDIKWKGKRKQLGKGDQMSNLQVNKLMKKEYKRKQKKGKKTSEMADKLADKLLFDVHVDGDDWENISNSAEDDGHKSGRQKDDYNFDTDFTMQ